MRRKFNLQPAIFLSSLTVCRLDAESPGISENMTASASSTSLASTSSTTPPSRFPFTNVFRDPFASHPPPPAPSALMEREVPPVASANVSIPTAPGYRYSASAEARRMSETPLVGENRSPGTARSHNPRRPSAPVNRRSSGFGRIPIPAPNMIGDMRTPRPSVAPTYSQSPEGSPLIHAAQPRLLRYRSSPGRSTGLGLQTLPSSSEAVGPASDTIGGDPANTVRSRDVRSRLQSGSWASVDVVDSYKPGIGNASSRSPKDEALVLVERRPSEEEEVTEFGGRNRFESIDSALPVYGGRFHSLPSQLAGWSNIFHRRGSLAMLGRTPPGQWDAPVTEERSQRRAHWSERRGSWAEGWGPKGA